MAFIACVLLNMALYAVLTAVDAVRPGHGVFWGWLGGVASASGNYLIFRAAERAPVAP